MRIEDLRIGQLVTVVGEYAGEWQGQTPEIVGLNRVNKGSSSHPLWVDDVTLKDSWDGVYDGFKPSDIEVNHGPLPEDRP